MKFRLDLQLFAEQAGPAAGAVSAGDSAGVPAGGGAETAAAEPNPAPASVGDTLADGSTVKDARVAAALNKQMRKHPELRAVYGQAAQQSAQATEAPAEKTAEERWEEAKKGEFAEFYGRDVQSAIKDRFKNQQDIGQQLSALEPMLKVLRDRAGVESNEALIKTVMDDDSLYEEEASARGMTIPAYKEFMSMQQQLQETQQREEQSIREQQIREHFGKLQQQAEAMRQMYPDFDLQAELQNPNFLRLTSPEVGVSVEDAYYAIHHKELAPQMMAYGMQRAKEQMGQTLQAQRQRPAEGAMRNQGQPAAEVRLDPRNLTRKERAEIKRQIMLGKRVSFD